MKGSYHHGPSYLAKCSKENISSSLEQLTFDKVHIPAPEPGVIMSAGAIYSCHTCIQHM